MCSAFRIVSLVAFIVVIQGFNLAHRRSHLRRNPYIHHSRLRLSEGNDVTADDLMKMVQELTESVKNDGSKMSKEKFLEEMKKKLNIVDITSDTVALEVDNKPTIKDVKNEKAFAFSEMVNMDDGGLDEYDKISFDKLHAQNCRDTSGLTDEEVFNHLRLVNCNNDPEDPLLSINSFRVWSFITDAIDCQKMNVVQFDAIVDGVLGLGASRKRSTSLNLNQFVQIADILRGQLKTTSSSSVIANNSTNNSMLDERSNADSIVENIDPTLYAELYTKIKGENNIMTIETLKGWDGAKDLLESGMVQKSQFDGVVREVLGSPSNTNIDVTQFAQIINKLDGIVQASVVRMSSKDAKPIEHKNYDELFATLCDSEQLLSYSEIMNWEGIKNLIEDELITSTKVESLLIDICGVTSGVVDPHTLKLTREQFSALINSLDAFIPSSEASPKPNKVDIAALQDVFAASADTSSNEKVFENLYSTAKGKANVLTVKLFMQSNDIIQFLTNKSVKTELIMDIIDKVLGRGSSKIGKTMITYESFKLILDKWMDLIIGDETTNNTEVTDSLEMEAFDDMKGNKGYVTIQDFLNSYAVSNAMSMEIVTADTLNQMIQYVYGGSAASRNPSQTRMSWEQFLKLSKLMQEENDDDDDEQEEEEDIVDVLNEGTLGSDSSSTASIPVDAKTSEDMLKTLYDNLENEDADVTVKSLQKWSIMRQFIAEGILTKVVLNSAINDVIGPGAAVKKGTIRITKDQFFRIMRKIDLTSTQ